MPLTRRRLVGTVAATATTAMVARSARAQTPKIRIGVMNDLSGTYRDDGGPTAVACARQAVQEFAAGKGLDVEVIMADHQNKPDVGATIAREWLDRDGVDVIVDVPTSSVALAVNTIVRAKNKVFLNSGAATTDLTGAQCSPNTVHWTYDTYMLARSTGGAMVKDGGDSWYFVTANYVFGQQLQRDTARIVTERGAKVLGSVAYPFPETTDFSSLLLQAQASGAKVLALANAGGDTQNCIKQAAEFGLMGKMHVAALLLTATGVHGVGLQMAQGLRFSEAYYWDANDRTRAFNERMKGKTPNGIWPNMTQVGNYGAVLHYLKAVADMGAAAAKTDGKAVVARMKAMPTDDDCFGPGRIRQDGRKIHPVYLLEVKKPSESKHQWDTCKIVAITPAEEAFRPIAEGGCELVKS